MKEFLMQVRRRALSPLLLRLDDLNGKVADISSGVNELRAERNAEHSIPSYPELDFPALESWNMPDARLFANRIDLIASLSSVRGGVVAEIGVAQGALSEFLLNELQPAQFFALDTFELHLMQTVWGIPTRELLEGKSHLEFYSDRFSSLGDRIVIKQG